jgi:hypothetical protein
MIWFSQIGLSPASNYAYRVKREYPNNLIPFRAFVRLPPELFRERPGQKLYSVCVLRRCVCLARDSTCEGIARRFRWISTVCIVENELTDRDGIREV